MLMAIGSSLKSMPPKYSDFHFRKSALFALSTTTKSPSVKLPL
jgi:hypothetical protein